MITRFELKDIPLLKEFLNKAKYQSGSYNLITTLIWLDKWPLFYILKNNTMFLFYYEEDKLVALAPLVELNNLKQALVELKEIFIQENHEMRLAYIPKIVAAKMEVVFPNEFNYTVDRDYADYIYDAEKLRTYSGKKMQKKRNNLNYFIKNYGDRVSFKELNRRNVKELEETLDDWLKRKDHSLDATKEEKQGINRILELDNIDYKIGGVYIDDKLEGFSICSMLLDDCVEVNIEKANGEIRGLYQYLGSMMLKSFYPNVKYVNREDDSGILPLRKSKESYYPIDYWYVFNIEKKK